MNQHRSAFLRFIIALLVVTLPSVMFAAQKRNDVVATATGGGSLIQWQAAIDGYDRIVLRISLPSGESYSREFASGSNPSFSIQDLAGKLALDGVYRYELTVIPKISEDVKRQLRDARSRNDEAAAASIARGAGLTSTLVQSGAFTVASGQILSPEAVEAGGDERGSRFSTPTTNGAVHLTPVPNDDVIADDLIVQGSACVGLDCVNNESFGFDTIRVKENNLRIHFDDTSTGTGFPANDWRFVANDSASGGASYMAIEDSTALKQPFRVEAGSPSDALYVDSTGNIGLSTSTPGLNVHIVDTDTPAIRMEQTAAGGFTAQTWDIGANEANFFVRDVTGGSKLPFRIRPGAPTSSIDIGASGDVGIGTGSPSEKLHVQETVDVNTLLLVENTNATGTSAAGVIRAKADTAVVNFQAHGTARTVSRFGVTLGGWNEFLSVTGNGLAIGTNTTAPLIFGTNATDNFHIDGSGNIGINCNAPASDLVIASSAGCSTPSSSINAGSAQFTIASSRTFKEHIEPVAAPDILQKIKSIGVYNYDYINGPKDRIGLIAEDFHKVFERGSEKYIDGGEVQIALWLAVQQLAEQNQKLTERLATLESESKRANP